MTQKQQKLVQEYREWKRKHPDYPLVVHPKGQWSRKVRRKTHYFGPLDDPDGALQNWLAEKDYLLAGLKPPTCTEGITVQQLLDRHLADVDERIAAGKLARITRRDYLPLSAIFTAAAMSDTPVKSLGPEHFSSVMRVLETSNRTLRTQKNLIVAAKTVFNWGHGMGLFPQINFGPRFVAPSSEAIEVEQEQAGVLRFFDRELILAALKKATPKLKVAILLGINCGFYPGDSVAITLDHLHLDGEIPYHDFRREKTKRRRMAVLWPETVAAIVEYRDKYRHPKDGNERRLLLTVDRVAYARTGAGNGQKLAKSFNALINRIAKDEEKQAAKENRPAVEIARSDGVSLGSLRHTYGTVIDTVPDQKMIDLTMGHTNKSLQKRVYSQLNINELSRLKVIADTVREWLYKIDGHKRRRSAQ